MKALQTGIAYNLVANEVYALPAKAVLASSNGPIYQSQNGIIFDPVVLTNGHAALASMFIRAEGIGIIVSLKEYSAVVGTVPTSGGGGDLPTAALGQVLISQGDGVPPIFSRDLDVTGNIVANNGGVHGYTLNSGGLITLAETEFGSISQSESVGTLANISDSNTATSGAIIAGGGTFHVLGRWDGAVWKVIG